MLIVLGSIVTAQSLSQEDHTGDRCAVLFLAMLILVTSMQQDLGLGNVTSVLWLDKFCACQFLLVLLSLQMTVIVHRLASHHQQALAKHTDNVTTVAMPFLIYPVCHCASILRLQGQITT
eukprot:6920516-Prymnesium_polylepis.1